MRNRYHERLLSICLILAACAGELATQDTGPPDATSADTTVQDASYGNACDEANVVVLQPTFDAEARAIIDTSAVRYESVDQGLCGYGAKQVMLAIDVPGEGAVGIIVSTDNEGTDSEYNTVLQLRGTVCGELPEHEARSCFADIDDRNLRSVAGFSAEGGSVVYVLLSGVASEGVAEVSVRAVSVARVPLLEEMTVSRVDGRAEYDRFRFRMTGSGASYGRWRFIPTFFDSDDAVVPLYLESTSVPFPEEIETVEFEDVIVDIYGDSDLSNTVQSVAVVLVGPTEQRSEAVTAPVHTAQEQRLGASCDGTTRICMPPHRCADSLCIHTRVPSTVDLATFLSLDGNFRIHGSGTSPERNADAISVRWLDDEMRPVDITGDGTVNGYDRIVRILDADQRGSLELDIDVYVAKHTIPGGYHFPPEASHVKLALLDRMGYEGDGLLVEIASGTAVHAAGEACDMDLRICTPRLQCLGGMCSLPPAMHAVCATASELPLSVQTVASAEGVLRPGSGALSGLCVGGTPGAEAVFVGTVPREIAGLWDIVASTHTPETGEADTMLHAQAECGVGAYECNDDIASASASMGRIVASEVVVRDQAAGDRISFVVESAVRLVDDERLPFGLTLRLRPVREAGQSCDPAGQDDRCRNSLCDEEMERCL